MATTDSKVTVGEIVSATVKYSNKDDASRVYDISADVRIENGTAQSFDNGMVQPLGQNSDGMGVSDATFNSWSENNASITFNNSDSEKAVAITAAVYAFMADVKASIVSKPTAL